MGVLGKLHNIVVYSRSSALRVAEFKKIVRRMIPLDNRTRWNSWYSLLDAALKVDSQIDQFTKVHFEDLDKDILTPQDWKNLRTIFQFLRPFYRATLALQGDTARLDKVLFEMDIILSHIESSIVRFLFLSPLSILY